MSLSTVLGHIWEGDHEVVENLKELESSFWVLLRGEDPGSQRSLLVVKHFLQTHKPKIPVVTVSIKTGEDAASNSAAMVPQLRIYHRGREVFRHRGIANVDVLFKVYQMSLRD